MLEELRVVLLPEANNRRRFQNLFHTHHYLGGLKPVGEQLYYVAVDGDSQWLALMIAPRMASSVGAGTKGDSCEFKRGQVV